MRHTLLSQVCVYCDYSEAVLECSNRGDDPLSTSIAIHHYLVSRLNPEFSQSFTQVVNLCRYFSIGLPFVVTKLQLCKHLAIVLIFSGLFLTSSLYLHFCGSG